MNVIDTQPHERRCLATGATRSRVDLVRFVVSPDGALVPDLEECLPGRGLWVTTSRSQINDAVRKKLFARAAKREITVDPGLADQVEALILKRCVSYLGLAKRAGEAVNGFEKVATWLRSGRAIAWVVASDAAQGGRDKIRSNADVSVVNALSREELSLALGGENVVHAALAEGGIARRFLAETVRLAGIRGSGPDRDLPSTAAVTNSN
ncbi:MAG: RNA-binding protein [Alphaproteobacteria bacterium]|nr:RNA-binding protein [Alphaproteobacteria bacterium]